VFEPVNTGRISGEIVQQIKAAIRNRKLVPGDQLPPERDLTRQLGVSRVSVRDALRTLEAHGLVEVRVGARGGAFVTAPAPKLVGEGLTNMLMLASVTPAEVTEARIVFELAMLDLAVQRATDEDLAELEEICDRADLSLASGSYDVALSARFHTRLARCTHNHAVALFAETLHGAVLVSLEQAQQIDPAVGRTGTVEHRALVDAIRARDAEAARRIMAEHLGRTARRVRGPSPP
jgi:GntR family transcriptional regulator, transcriptional repressor for pyruvate dehydrogenase complex